MKVFWLLVVLNSPLTGDGLIAGWQAEYPTKKACDAAAEEALRRSQVQGHAWLLTQVTTEARCEKRWGYR